MWSLMKWTMRRRAKPSPEDPQQLRAGQRRVCKGHWGRVGSAVRRINREEWERYY